MGESGGAQVELRQVTVEFGLELFEAAVIADHEVRTRAFLFEGQLLGFAARHLPRIPAPARSGSPRTRQGFGVHEEELVTLPGQAVCRLVLEEQGDVEHDARNAPRTCTVQERAYPGTDSRVGKAFEPRAFGWRVEDHTRERLPVGQAIGPQDSSTSRAMASASISTPCLPARCAATHDFPEAMPPSTPIT